MSIYPKLLQQIEQLEKEVRYYPPDRFASIIAALRAAPKVVSFILCVATTAEEVNLQNFGRICSTIILG